MYKDEEEIKKEKKRSKLIKAFILMFLGIILLIGSYFIVKRIQGSNGVVFVPEETQLDLYVSQNNLIIEAHNSQGLVQLMYKWDEQESYSLYPSAEDNASLSINVPILNGEHKLYVEVIDANGNKTIKEQKIKGVTDAKINIQTLSGYYVVNVEDEQKIISIEYEFNGTNYSVDVGDTNKFSFMKKMEYGQNYIKVTVQNSQGVYSTKEMKYEY